MLTRQRLFIDTITRTLYVADTATSGKILKPFKRYTKGTLTSSIGTFKLRGYVLNVIYSSEYITVKIIIMYTHTLYIVVCACILPTSGM